MSLLSALDPFYQDHRQCGELEAGVDGPVVWIGCECTWRGGSTPITLVTARSERLILDIDS